MAPRRPEDGRWGLRATGEGGEGDEKEAAQGGLSSASLTVGLYLMGVAQDLRVRGRVARLKSLECSAWAGSRQVNKGCAV